MISDEQPEKIHDENGTEWTYDGNNSVGFRAYAGKTLLDFGICRIKLE